MPIAHEQAREIARRLARGRAVEGLARLLAPKPESERPFSPPLPASRSWDEEARQERIAFVEALGGPIPHVAGRAGLVDPETLRGNIENYIGMAQVPIGVVGPLRVNGLHAQGDFYVPLATAEGALVASYDRGVRVMTQAGGASAIVTSEQVQRAPGFAFRTLAESALFAQWLMERFEHMRDIASRRTSHGRLLDASVHLQANHVYLILDYHTGDAAGQNMVTFCTAEICEDIIRSTPFQPEYWFIEANMSGDKKATALSFARTRGRNVTAECTIGRELVERRLHTTPERMADYWRMSFVGGVQTGSIGVSGHIANGLAGLFLATGQDVACVSEAAVGVTRMEPTSEGDLYAAVNLPNLIVGTVGGGTRLPTARECLRIMQCDGDDRAARYAEICASLVLGGELSIVAALCSGDFAKAHETLGRPR